MKKLTLLTLFDSLTFISDSMGHLVLGGGAYDIFVAGGGFDFWCELYLGWVLLPPCLGRLLVYDLAKSPPPL